MAVLIEQQDGRCDRWFRRWTIGRLEVDIPRSRVTVIEVWASLLLGQQILQLAAVTGPDFLAQRILSAQGSPRPRRCAGTQAPRRQVMSTTPDHLRPITIEIPVTWTAEQALAVWEILDETSFHSPNARLVVISVLLF